MLASSLLLAIAIAGTAQEPGQPLNLKTSFTKKEVDRYVELYRFYELPMPPPNAHLVLLDRTAAPPRSDTIALRAPAKGSRGSVIYFGTAVLTEEQAKAYPESGPLIKVADSDPRVAQVVPCVLSRIEFWSNNLAATAIQLAALGRREPALKILPLCFMSNLLPLANAQEWTTPEWAVADLAWMYALNQWIESKGDRASVPKLLDKIVKANPVDAYFTEEIAKQAEGMRLALKPLENPTKEEALIAQLIEADTEKLAAIKKEIKSLEHGRQLMEDHLGDLRLTRRTFWGPQGVHFIMTIGDFMKEWLEGS